VEDRFGRPLRSLRISVTGECNLRCFYCHREGMEGGGRRMGAEELGRVAEVASSLGMRRVKLTGGEPLLREDLEEVVREVAEHAEEVSLVTNGVGLEGRAGALAGAGLRRVNVSLDTLDPEKYARLTGVRALDRVVRGIEAALDAGLVPVKLNMLLLRGVNEEEVEGMVEFARERGAKLQLLELIRLPWDPPRIYEAFHLDLSGVEGWLRERGKEVGRRGEQNARRVYRVDGVEVEVVRPMHNSEFCLHCTRLRLTHDGYLKPCLMRRDNLVDLLTPLREGREEEVRRAFELAVERREPFFRGPS
jgi:cyclic pyranopterin phosphate synthase